MSSTQLSLIEKLDPEYQGLVALFGTVPGVEERRESFKNITAELLLHDLTPIPDAYIVYHIQDEPSRDGSVRPFPFRPNIDPFLFVQDVSAALRARVPEGPVPTALLFQVTPAIPKPHFDSLLASLQSEPESSGVSALTLVGSPSSDFEAVGYALGEAADLVKQRVQRRVPLGGIMLPERHVTKRDEPQRMIAKQRAGVTFFTTQVVYDVDLLLTVLREYSQAIAALQQQETPATDPAQVPAARIILTFAPFSVAKTAQFLRWLGVSVPQEVEARVLGAEDPALESVKVCRENFQRIMAFCKEELGGSVPIGISVESVTGFRKDIAASFQLYSELAQDFIQFHS